MPPLSVEGIVSSYDQSGFERRQTLVHETGTVLGLTTENAVIIGGAGFLLHGLDAHVRPRLGKARFDVDAYVSENFFRELNLSEAAQRHVFRLRSDLMPDGRQIDPPVVPLQFTGFDGGHTWHDDLGLTYYSNYAQAAEDRIEASGLPTVSADRLAAIKVKVGRSKDLAGIIQAHVIGQHFGNPIVHEPEWQDQVAIAADRLLRRDIYKPSPTGNVLLHHMRMGNSIPLWLGNLTARRFAHPAFQDVRL